MSRRILHIGPKFKSMSIPVRKKRVSVPDIRARKGGEPLVCLTAYTAPIASILNDRVDVLLVGDSLGMVVYGMDDTLAVTLDMMIAPLCAPRRRRSSS
jgi:3-methyl-2-oxobutanoate hydroxymethyltransferase